MKIHLIAVGGSAMHNLAIALQCNHHTVSGSDDEIYNPARDRLAERGLLPSEMGWFPDRISKDLDVIILGMHARGDNPELQRAQELGIPVYSYPEYLYNHAQDKKRLVVAGSHGKTTTTAMIMHALNFYHWDYDYLVGAQLEGFDNMVKLSDAPLMVIEGDEYLSSPIDRRPKFLHYRPHWAIVTGIAWDHINVFPTFEEYVQQFALLLGSMAEGGEVFAYAHDEHLNKICRETERTDLRIQAYESFPHRNEAGTTWLTLPEGEYPLQIFGQHNLENLKAACLACQAIGMNQADFLKAIASFKGAAKRLQLLAENNSALAYQDFAHAPSKVKATIQALKNQYPERQLTACLELHTFSSLNKSFLPHYRGAMQAADKAYVYFADHTLEMKKLPPISQAEVLEHFDHPNLEVIKDNALLQARLRSANWTDHNLLLMSSGTFGGINLAELANTLIDCSPEN